MFERKPLRTDVAAEIQGRIIDGRLAAGTRINESQLSAAMGISRTPLREAMLCLTTEGALASDMGRGFRVPRLDGRELSDLLETLAVVYEAAVRRADDGGLKDVFEARNILGRARLQTAEPAALCEQLYLLLRHLIRGCHNDILRREGLRLVRLVLRYINVGIARGFSPEGFLAHMDAGLADLEQGGRPAAAVRFAHALADLGSDLAPRFPTEATERA
ncbi:MAG: GntR family transcriptional regulator [Candidatus Krumholzibacteriia bacterium]